VGFFGPIGVSAIFYLYVSLEYLRINVLDHGHEREDAERLGEIMVVVIWFLVICSIVVHGLSIPLGKLGFYIPRTLSQALSQENSRDAFHIERTSGASRSFDRPDQSSISVPAGVYRIGRTLVRGQNSGANSKATSRKTSRHVTPRASPPRTPISPSSPVLAPGLAAKDVERLGHRADESSNSDEIAVQMPPTDSMWVSMERVNNPLNRSIRFPDEAQHAPAQRHGAADEEEDS